MSWSTELWDQFDTISKHTAKGIDFLEKFGQFIKDRCVVEIDYACNLKKLVKTYDVKKKNENDKDFSYCKAFTMMLKELSDMAGQHEVIAETLSAQITREITTINKDLRDERKRYLNEGAKYQSLLNNSLNQLDKSKRSYDKAFKESEKAQDNYQKADKDLNLSRAELEKAKTTALNKERACEDCKTSYARQLQIVNQAQREHYTKLMPKIFQQLQDMEARRIECTRNFIRLSAMIQRNVAPIIEKCLDGICDAAKSVNPAADAQLVVERYKSGMQPPDDIPFEDLSSRANGESEESSQSKGNSLSHSQPSKSDYFRHTFTARGLKKKTILSSIFGANKNEYSDLPPNQKRKKIQVKIDQLNSQIIQANHAKDGLLKMRQAYEENTAFGDPKTIENGLKETEATLIRLNNELKKHLTILEELDSSKNNSICENDTMSNSPSLNNSNHRSSTARPFSESSRTNSEHSLKLDLANRDATKSTTTNRTSNSFNDSYSDTTSNANFIAQDNVDTTDSNKNQIGNGQVNEQQYSDTYEAPSELPSQANARALYSFKEGPLGSIPMNENEIFDVIEFDHGDGWTRVRRLNFDPDAEDAIGFVPTSYISIDANKNT